MRNKPNQRIDRLTLDNLDKDKRRLIPKGTLHYDFRKLMKLMVAPNSTKTLKLASIIERVEPF